jgi:Flp pilus assembly protein TadD
MARTGPDAPPNVANETAVAGDKAIHREMLQLGMLVVIAILGFFFTRSVASSNRATTFRDAEAWFERGEQLLAAGRMDEAIESLRRASVRNRFDRRYALGLAHALAQKGDSDAARAALLTLREASPEDAEINLELARLAARRQDVTDATRFYHNALYAAWPAGSESARRQVRLELVEFLLQHGQTARGVAELLAMTGDLPDDAGTHVRVAQLFARAGDARRALDHFERALRLAPTDDAALVGAGASAFALADFARARRYLRQAHALGSEASRMRDVAEFVLSNDPVARGIGAPERRRRLRTSLDYLQDRLTGCSSGLATPAAGPVSPMLEEVDALRRQLQQRAPVDQDLIEAGVGLFDRIERHLAVACAPMTARDEALASIARRAVGESR